MGRMIDKSFIHHRILNRSRGAAVHGLRAQVDRDVYQRNMQRYLSKLKNLDIVEAQ